MFVIFGTRPIEKTLSTGKFQCPVCGGERPYAHKQISLFFTLFFIPVFKIRTIGEFVECLPEQHAYRPQILTHTPLSPAIELLACVRADLEAGVSAGVVRDKLVRAGLPDDIAPQIVRVASAS